ncbi:hypothetical protein [Bradyrhizobium sp. STM 3557]|uniref:hypothetical protein n=1 Tax=Bradyrhizobium sp. STM 3557 TaxID=578920 RepID=UPI00388F3158
MAVIFVLICVARASLALTAAWIRAPQSMLLVVLVPDVEIELVELDDEDDDEVVLLVPEVALLTVMTGTCQKRTGPASCRPGRSFVSRAA